VAEDRLWGWIPNISGSSYDEVHTQSQLDKAGDCRFRYYSSESMIEISDPHGRIKVTFQDPGGLCTLVTETELEGYHEGVWIRGLWKELRGILDSCSSYNCNCSAMIKPVMAGSHNAHEMIAKRFIDTMEHMSDNFTYMTKDFKGFSALSPDEKIDLLRTATERVNVMSSEAAINHAYGVRFIEIYAHRFDDDRRVAELKSVMHARLEKVNALCDKRKNDSDLEFQKESIRKQTESSDSDRKLIKGAAVGVAVTAVGVVVSVILSAIALLG